MDSRGRLLGKKSKRPCSNAWPYHLGRKKKKQRNEGHHFSYSGFTMLKNEHPCSKLLRFRNVKPCRGFCMQPASRFSHGGTYLYISHVGLSRQAGTTGAWTAKFRSTGMSAGKTNCTEMGVRISSLPFNRDGTRKKKVVWESQRLQNSINFGFNLCAKLLNSRSCHHISSLLLLRWYFIFFKGPFFFLMDALIWIWYIIVLAQHEEFIQHVCNTVIGCKSSNFSSCLSRHLSLGHDMSFLCWLWTVHVVCRLEGQWHVGVPILARLWKYSGSNTLTSRLFVLNNVVQRISLFLYF